MSRNRKPDRKGRLAALDGLAHLHRTGNEHVRAAVLYEARRLIDDDSKAVSAAAIKLITALNPQYARREAEAQARPEVEELRWVPAVSSSPQHSWGEEQGQRQVITSPTLSPPLDDTTDRSGQVALEAWADLYTQAGAATEKQTPQWARRGIGKQARRKADLWTSPFWWFLIISLFFVLVVVLVSMTP